MTKTKKGGGKKRSNPSSSSGNNNAQVWDGADHVMRQERQMNKRAKKQDTTTDQQLVRQERRDRLTTKRTHDSREKRESSKLRLNITKTQRDIDKLRKRLQQWDEVEEAALLETENLAALPQPKKKKGRLGPETWKLKGAARPAWQVCEFDVRYECPHQKAHDQAKAKAKRIRNLLAQYKGSFGHGGVDDLSYPHRRQFLALLMQYALLNQEAKKYKTARMAFLECLELEGVQTPITDARCHLMRLYLQVNRPQSVHQLWTTRLLPAADRERSVWVLYSVALVEYIRWTQFQESGRLQAEQALARAIRGNIYCAYYLAYSEVFHQCMEYTDDIEHARDDQPLLEAIEYCDSEQMGMWMGTEGALEWLQATVLRALRGQDVAKGELTKEQLDWNTPLQAMEQSIKEQQREKETQGDNDDNKPDEDEQEEEEEEVDTIMYAGMFRTTMEMLESNGSLAQVPPAIVEDDNDNAKEEPKTEDKAVSDEKQSSKDDDSDNSDESNSS